MPELNESLIKKLEADIGRGLGDTELQEKHDISQSTWDLCKQRGSTDRQNDLTTIYTLLLDILREVLNESLIKKLEADIRRGLFDYDLRKKHDISESTWYKWKYKGVINRNNGLKTSHTMLLDILWEGREVVKQLENIVAEAALGVTSISVTTYTETDREKSSNRTKKLPPDL